VRSAGDHQAVQSCIANALRWLFYQLSNRSFHEPYKPAVVLMTDSHRHEERNNHQQEWEQPPTGVTSKYCLLLDAVLALV